MPLWKILIKLQREPLANHGNTFQRGKLIPDQTIFGVSSLYTKSPPATAESQTPHTPNAITRMEIGQEINFSVVTDSPRKLELDASSSLLNTSRSVSGNTVKWEIKWLHEPIQLPLLTLCGIILAVGHHCLYWKLDGHSVSSDNGLSQQVVKQAGNAFAFLVIASLKAAIDGAYNQYIWTVLRSRSLKIGALDKLFSLPSRIMSFSSFQLLGTAKIALLIGSLSWLLFLGGLTPAATLSIVPATRPRIISSSVPVPNYSSDSWSQTESLETDDTVNPTAQMLKLATETAFNMAVVPPAAPTLNSSFQVQFYGPTVQCNDASANEILAFDAFTVGYVREASTYTESTYDPVSGDYVALLVISAFSPTIDVINDEFVDGRPNEYNNWDAELSGYQDASGAQQIWLQTSNRSIVCTLANASFSIEFEFSNGVGAVKSQIVDIIPNGNDNTSALYLSSDNTSGSSSNITTNTNAAYFTTLIALGSTLFGNVSLDNTTVVCVASDCSNLNLAEASSHILETGLVACDEMAHNYWYSNYGLDNPNLSRTNLSGDPRCRNSSLERGIEDLANNITISMLSSASFTKNTTGVVNIVESVNVYSYDSKSLLISYGIAILVTLIVVLVGLLSIQKNGIYHESSFSAIMLATRNRDLDRLAEGTCLGDTKGIREEELMFGILTPNDGLGRKDRAHGDLEDNSNYKHASFGLQGSVTTLKRGIE